MIDDKHHPALAPIEVRRRLQNHYLTTADIEVRRKALESVRGKAVSLNDAIEEMALEVKTKYRGFVPL